MKLQKIAGISSIVNTIIILILLALGFFLLPRLGPLGAWDDAAKLLDAMIAFPIIFSILSLVLILCGIPYIFIVLGIKERMQDSAPNYIQVIIIAVAVTCTLWIASGSIGFFGLPSIVHTNDISALSTANAMQTSLIFAGDSAAGWVLFLIGCAALKTSSLSKALSYLAVIKGIVMILEVAVQPQILGLIGLLLGVPFYPWLGIELLRNKS